MGSGDLLASWTDTPTRASIEGFVAAVTDPVELGFILGRLAEQAGGGTGPRPRS